MSLVNAIPIATNWTTLMVSPVPAICSMLHTWMFSKKHIKGIRKTGELDNVGFQICGDGQFFSAPFLWND